MNQKVAFSNSRSAFAETRTIGTRCIGAMLYRGDHSGYRKITRHSVAWLSHGRVETKDSVIHVVVQHLEDMSTRLANLRTTSRDFR